MAFNQINLRCAMPLTFVSVLTAACSTYNGATQRIAQHITPYRITVVQGNFVSREAAAKLQVGMPRAQVEEILGAPLLKDPFHANRWDYIFYFKRGANAVLQQQRFIVYFDGDKVARLDGGEHLLSEKELIMAIDGDKRANTRSKQKAAIENASKQTESNMGQREVFNVK